VGEKGLEPLTSSV